MLVNYDSCIVNFFKIERSAEGLSVDVTDYEYDWDEDTHTLILKEYIGSGSDIETPEMVDAPRTLVARANPSTATINVKYGSVDITSVGEITIVDIPYGTIAIITASAPGYDAQSVPCTIQDLDPNNPTSTFTKTVTLITTIDCGYITENSNSFSMGLITDQLDEESIDCGLLV